MTFLDKLRQNSAKLSNGYVLHNTVSDRRFSLPKELPYTVAALYEFKAIDQPERIKLVLKEFLDKHHVVGTLLLAEEGINGTVAGSDHAINLLYQLLTQQLGFNPSWKTSFAQQQPFLRSKVKLKKEIVTMGQPSAQPQCRVGTYVNPQDWNDLLNDPEVLIIDTRNDYEYDVGTFRGAINPNTETFRAFPDYVHHNLDAKKHKKVAMFCTGGIRCEKASSWMLAEGFEEVYHLKGGILKYLEEVEEQDSLWEGECFVFDERVTVTHGLKLGRYRQCFACRYPLTPEEMTSPHYEHGVSCHRCINTTTKEQKGRFEERQKQMSLAKQRGESHLGG